MASIQHHAKLTQSILKASLKYKESYIFEMFLPVLPTLWLVWFEGYIMFVRFEVTSVTFV